MKIEVIEYKIGKLEISSSLVMVRLQAFGANPLSIKANLPVHGLPQNRYNCSPKLPSAYPSLPLTNSQQSQHPIFLYPPVNQSVAAIVFGDGSESRLYPLTKRRSEAAIPIAANYRLIDAVVSNCINSNINKIYALTQVNSTSLNSHLLRAYSGARLGKEGFVEVIAAYQSPEHQSWFQGTADAIRRCLWLLEEYPVNEFLVLPGQHLYKMDYQKLIEAHRNSKSNITIAALSSMRDYDPGFGLLKVNSEYQVMEFIMKSDRESIQLKEVQNSRRSIDTSYSTHPSMGIYLINRDTMEKLLNEAYPKANDFGSEVIQEAVSTGMKVQAYLFDGYWEDFRNIEAFYQANMECIEKSHMGYKSVIYLPERAESIMLLHHSSDFASKMALKQQTQTPLFDYSSFYDRDSPVYNMPRCLPPTLISGAVVTDSVIGDGCILNSCKIKGSVVGMRTRIGDGAIVEDSVIMGYDTHKEEHIRGEEEKGGISLGIGENAQIRKAIIDKNARIGRNVMIINRDHVQEGDREAEGYIISGGIVVVLRSAEIPHGSIL